MSPAAGEEEEEEDEDIVGAGSEEDMVVEEEAVAAQEADVAAARDGTWLGTWRFELAAVGGPEAPVSVRGGAQHPSVHPAVLPGTHCVAPDCNIP